MRAANILSGTLAFALTSLCTLAHPALDRLGSSTTTRWDSFEQPYSFCQTTRRVGVALAALKKRVDIALRRSRLPVAAHFSAQGQSTVLLESLKLPAEFTTPKELKGLDACSLPRCFQKLQDSLEKNALIASHDRAKQYRTLILNRVVQFLRSQTLYGYEQRQSNTVAVQQMLAFFPYFKDYYPLSYAYFHKTFWTAPSRQSFIKDSFIRANSLSLNNDSLQPISWVAEVFAVHEASTDLYIEIPIYSNHYFDSWVRVYELLPIYGQNGQSAIVLTDLVEVDELKKSAIIRTLYKGKMHDAILEAQKAELSMVSAPPELSTQGELVTPASR